MKEELDNLIIEIESKPIKDVDIKMLRALYAIQSGTQERAGNE